MVYHFTIFHYIFNAIKQLLFYSLTLELVPNILVQTHETFLNKIYNSLCNYLEVLKNLFTFSFSKESINKLIDTKIFTASFLNSFVVVIVQIVVVSCAAYIAATSLCCFMNAYDIKISENISSLLQIFSGMPLFFQAKFLNWFIASSLANAFIIAFSTVFVFANQLLMHDELKSTLSFLKFRNTTFVQTYSYLLPQLISDKNRTVLNLWNSTTLRSVFGNVFWSLVSQETQQVFLLFIKKSFSFTQSSSKIEKQEAWLENRSKGRTSVVSQILLEIIFDKLFTFVNWYIYR